jgi:hypothetical protein
VSLLAQDSTPIPSPPSWLWGWVTPSNLPGFIAALIAVVALYFAIRSSRASQASAKTAQENLARLEDERSSSQAKLFSTWVVDVSAVKEISGQPDALGVTEAYMRASSARFRIAIRNASEATIHHVALFCQAPGEITPYLVGEVDIVPPGEKKALIYTRETIVPHYAGKIDVRLHTVFVDASGQTWVRYNQGGLERPDRDLYTHFHWLDENLHSASVYLNPRGRSPSFKMRLAE